MSILRSIAVGVGISLVTGLILGKNKLNQAKSVVNNLKIKLTKINSIEPIEKAVLINIDLRLENHSNVDFSADTGSLISLKKVQFFNKQGVLLGEAEKHINNIILVPYGNQEITNIDLIIPTKNIGALIQQLFSTNAGDLVPRINIEVFGEPYTI